MKLFNYEIVKKHKVTITWRNHSGFEQTIQGHGFSHDLLYFMLLQLNNPIEIEFDISWRPTLVKTVNEVTGFGDSGIW